jgi:hypothetical protein
LNRSPARWEALAEAECRGGQLEVAIEVMMVTAAPARHERSLTFRLRKELEVVVVTLHLALRIQDLGARRMSRFRGNKTENYHGDSEARSPRR